MADIKCSQCTVGLADCRKYRARFARFSQIGNTPKKTRFLPKKKKMINENVVWINSLDHSNLPNFQKEVG